MEPPTTAPMGWYPDSQVAGSERYWDGTAWTEQRRPAGDGPLASPPGWAAPGGAAQVVAQPVVVQQANGLAVAGLVCGIVGAVFGLIPFTFWLAWVLGVLAVVFGAIGRRRATQNPAAGRRKMASWGLGLGIAAIVLGIVGLVLLIAVIHHVHDTNCFNDPYQARCN